MWAPRLGLGCFGIQRIHLLRDCVILADAGVGGGSLNYANTLYNPPPRSSKVRSGRTDGEDEVTPYYQQSQRMLGVVRNPYMTPADQIMKAVGEDMRVGDTFIQTPVGVFFGEPGKTVPDPFFGGAERAAAMWPNKGEKDQRPEQGRGYRRIQPTRPRHPVVPEGVPGALRLPLVEIRPKATDAPQTSGTGVA